MDATHAKVQISRWKDLFVPFQWKLPTTASKDKVPNVDSAYRVSVAVSAPTAHAGLPQKLQEVSAAQVQTRSLPAIS